MPCPPQRARRLLKEGKAKVVSHRPFTLQLLVATGETVQEVSLGVDSGAKYIGMVATSQGKVLAKGVVELRDDVKECITSRRILRRSRRSRKTRYRHCKFKYKSSKHYDPKKKKWVKKKRTFESDRNNGWLPPSIQSRVDNQISWIQKFARLLPSPRVAVELGKFDVQKMMNPAIEGKEYQQGDSYGYFATRYYVLARDNYTCQICKGKSKDRILNTHHIIKETEGGSNRAENLVTLCSTCHKAFHEGKITHTFKKPKQYKETAFMNILRQQVIRRLECEVTYGNITTVDRKLLGLEKSHVNDAIAVSGIKSIKSNPPTGFCIRQFRKKKRSLHEATARKGRKEKNTTSKRNSKNTKSSNEFFLNDKVRLLGKTGFICGFTGGGAYVKDIEGSYITLPGKTYKQVGFKELEFVSHNNNWQMMPVVYS